MRLFRKLNFTYYTQTEYTEWLLVSAPKTIRCSINSNGAQLEQAAFTHIEHRAGAVGREGFVS